MPDQACPEPCRRVRHDEVVSRRLTNWNRAFARFQAAEAGLAAVAHTEDDALYDRLLGRFNRALRALVCAPAPDLRAFSVKLDLAVDREVASLTGGEGCMAALKRDARRLARATGA
jgi:hypothetical protein